MKIVEQEVEVEVDEDNITKEELLILEAVLQCCYQFHRERSSDGTPHIIIQMIQEFFQDSFRCDGVLVFWKAMEIIYAKEKPRERDRLVLSATVQKVNAFLMPKIVHELKEHFNRDDEGNCRQFLKPMPLWMYNGSAGNVAAREVRWYHMQIQNKFLLAGGDDKENVQTVVDLFLKRRGYLVERKEFVCLQSDVKHIYDASEIASLEILSSQKKKRFKNKPKKR